MKQSFDQARSKKSAGCTDPHVYHTGERRSCLNIPGSPKARGLFGADSGDERVSEGKYPGGKKTAKQPGDGGPRYIYIYIYTGM